MKKTPKGKTVDLEFVKKNYLRDFEGCSRCGSEDLEFKKGKKTLGLPSFTVRCKKCGADLGSTSTIID